MERFGICALLVFLLLPAAAEAASCPAPEARQFDFWLGEWEIENRQRSPRQVDDPRWSDTGTTHSRVESILGGCAILELLHGMLSWGQIEGFSVRTYDPEDGRWHLVLNWPSEMRPEPGFFTLTGAFDHHRAEIFAERPGPEDTTMRIRYTFSDIRHDSFRWDMAQSTDGGNLWRPVWIMNAERTEEKGRGPFVAMGAGEVDEPLCTGDEHRALDGWLGVWEAAGEGAGDETLEIVSILDGCGVMALTEGGAPDVFRILAWLPDEEAWVAYGLDEGTPTFERLEGTLEDGVLTLEASSEEGSEGSVRETWSLDAEGLLVFERPDSGDARRYVRADS